MAEIIRITGDEPCGFYHRPPTPRSNEPLKFTYTNPVTPPSWEAVSFHTMPRFQPWAEVLDRHVQMLVRTSWAIQEISVIRIISQHPWAWDLIGVTRWARLRRSC